MKACSIRKLLCFLALLSISACATNPTQTDDTNQSATQPKPFNESPGDITFGNIAADVMYEILIAEIAVQRGNPQVGAEFYADAAKRSRDPRIASRAVRIATFANATDEALAAAQVWIESEPDSAEAQRILAVLYLRNKNHEKAQDLLNRLLSRDENTIGPNLLLTGALLQREAGKEGAEKIAAYLVTLYPNYAESHFIHASLAMQIGQMKVALASAEAALAIRPRWVDAATLYPRVLVENGKNSEALDYLASFVKNNPKSDVLRLAYARFLVDERKLKDARSQFELLAIKMPNNPDVLFALAMLSMQTRDFDEAESYLMQLSSMDKAAPQVRYYLGYLAEQKEDLTAATSWYSLILNGEYFVESQLRISVILAKTKNIEEARAHLRTIPTKTDKEKHEVILFEGNLLRDLKFYQAAFDYYTDLLETDKKNSDYLYYRSLIAERLNLVDVVIRDLSYVISKDPENAAALNALGYTLADRTDRLEEALKLIERAKDLEPDDAAIIDSLGWVNFRLGNHQIALKYLKQAMDKIEDAEVAAHLGEVLWTMGKKDEAIEVWSKARKQFEDNEILQETLKRFNQ